MSERTMRAARFHGGSTGLRLETVPWPVPGPDDVVVRVAACGICGSDVHFLEGMPVPAPLPVTLGHEPAGLVETLGTNVSGWKVGDRVAIHLGTGCGACATCRGGSPSACRTQRSPGLHIDGAFAEAIRVPATCLVRVPDGVSLAAAALATDCVTSPYHALACRGKLEPGERVVVIGVGGLGAMAVRLARVLGADSVVAVDVSPVALERASKVGADACVRIAPGEDPALELQIRTQGGADLAIECVGRPETVSLGVRALRPGGRLVVVGVGMQPPRIDLPQALFCVGELAVAGSFASHVEDLARVLALEAEGRLDIEASISHRLPLERVAEGLEMLRTKTGDPQRIVVEMDV
ncbi:MAG: zinc-binding dehydrogenase [Deltaproteobacteria bacterium]|nr:zinc-binding dehydrogenase [Deltaproteobacteria bacterium]